MARLDIEPVSYTSAAHLLATAQGMAGTAVSSLTSGLSGTGSMAGHDPSGQTFSTDYDQMASGIVSAMDDVFAVTGVLAQKLVQTGNTWADAEHHASGGKTPPGTDTVGVELSGTGTAVPPSAAGGDIPVPDGWNWIAAVAGVVWPDGDPSKLRDAARAWKNASNDLELIKAQVQGVAPSLTGIKAPEIPLIETKMSDFGTHLGDLVTACDQMDAACTEHARTIEDAHTEIGNEILEMLAFMAVTEAAAAALAVVTVGVSEAGGVAAVVARIAVTSARVGAVCSRVLEAATQVATKIRTVLAIVSKATTGLKELKIIKPIVSIGEKSPAWAKVGASIAGNTGLNLGIDAALNGGTPGNIGADLAGGLLPFGMSKALNGARDLTKVDRLANGLKPPGLNPPVSPAIGDTLGGPGRIVGIGLKDNPAWARYQSQISGLLRSPDGKVLEYRVGGVKFDGVHFRGDPPAPVLLDAKLGYTRLNSPGYNPNIAKALIAEARRQINHADGIPIEWHVSSSAGAENLQRLLDRQRIVIKVVHTEFKG
ncbi:hypothetical protein ABH924_004428 [Arthrobacter sp. GAS37]|uniref:WXG100-like domain-containing protein n=1 Tax=Arthrobacter sp. GAS37 TaxID=3156261 RepID=UPI0038387A94